MSEHAVAISGFGALVPGDAAALARALRGEGAPLAGAVASPLASDLAEAVRTRVARAERVTQLAASAAGRAFAAAGIETPDAAPAPDRGVVLGTAFGCWLSNASHQERVRTSGPAAASPRVFAATVSNAAAGEIGIAYRLGGPAVTASQGAASGLGALQHAFGLVRDGRCAVVLAGGADALGPSLERWMADSGTRTHPLTEAAAFAVLEPTGALQSRGGRPLATVLAAATGFEPYDPATGTGARAAIRAALDAADLAPAALRVIVRAAPPPASLAEARALADLVEDADLQVLPAKARLGECLGAAGPLGLMTALAALAPGEVGLVLDWCWTGHVAALLVRCESTDPAGWGGQ